MSVALWVYGNHSIAFKGKEIADKKDVLNRLNSLKLEEYVFLLEMVKKWHSPLGYDEKWDKKRTELLERDIQIHSWRILFEDDIIFPHTVEYEFVGPYGLYTEITKNYIFIRPWVGRYHHWYWTEKKEDIEWRDTWRFIIFQIINVLGGDSALYFPDNMSDLSAYLPTKYNLPKFNKLVQVILDEYKPCFTSFAEATKRYMANTLENDPFVIDKFDDLRK